MLSWPGTTSATNLSLNFYSLCIYSLQETNKLLSSNPQVTVTITSTFKSTSTSIKQNKFLHFQYGNFSNTFCTIFYFPLAVLCRLMIKCIKSNTIPGPILNLMHKEGVISQNLSKKPEPIEKRKRPEKRLFRQPQISLTGRVLTRQQSSRLPGRRTLPKEPFLITFQRRKLSFLSTYKQP